MCQKALLRMHFFKHRSSVCMSTALLELIGSVIGMEEICVALGWELTLIGKGSQLHKKDQNSVVVRGHQIWKLRQMLDQFSPSNSRAPSLS